MHGAQGCERRAYERHICADRNLRCGPLLRAQEDTGSIAAAPGRSGQLVPYTQASVCLFHYVANGSVPLCFIRPVFGLRACDVSVGTGRRQDLPNDGWPSCVWLHHALCSMPLLAVFVEWRSIPSSRANPGGVTGVSSPAPAPAAEAVDAAGLVRVVVAR